MVSTPGNTWGSCAKARGADNNEAPPPELEHDQTRTGAEDRLGRTAAADGQRQEEDAKADHFRFGLSPPLRLAAQVTVHAQQPPPPGTLTPTTQHCGDSPCSERSAAGRWRSRAGREQGRAELDRPRGTSGYAAA